MIDYPGWIEALGTTGSLVAGVIVFRNESRRARAVQASELMIYQDFVPFNPKDQCKTTTDEGTERYRHSLHFTNTSKTQFESLYVLARRQSRRKLNQAFKRKLIDEYHVPKWQRDRTRWERAGRVPTANGRQVLLPGESASIRFMLDYPIAFYQFHIFFDDSAGGLWYRILSGNPLEKSRPLRPVGSWDSIHALYKDWDQPLSSDVTN